MASLFCKIRDHEENSMKLTILLSFVFVGICPTLHAAFSDDFTELRAELVDRSAILSNFTDKIQIKQKKAVDKAIVAIDKPATDLGKDIQTAKKVASSMAKTFPNEFAVVTPLGAPSFNQNIQDILVVTFSNLTVDVQAEINDLLILIFGLPDGKDKVKANLALDAALTAIGQLPSTDFANASKRLGTALKAARKGQKIASSAPGGDPSNTFSATIGIGGTNYNFTAIGNAQWFQNSGNLDIGGSDGAFQLTAAQCANFTGATGDYNLGDSCGGVFDLGVFHFYGVTNGTLHVTAFDAPTTSLSGTFAFEASDGVTSVTVSNGMFDLHDLLISNGP
jgi:hypothetical protein